MYRCRGEIFLEGSNESAFYDFEMEADQEPDDMEVFNYMVQTGVIQIIHESAVPIDSKG
jgi:hypothetical protein